MGDNIKITERKCPTCGGVLKINAGQKVVQCEYCGNEYTVETEPEQQGSVEQKRPQWEMAAPERSPELETSRAGKIAITVFILCVIVATGAGIYRKNQEDARQEERRASMESVADSLGTYAPVYPAGASGEGGEDVLSGMLAQMAAYAFGKEPEDVTKEDLSRIQWIADESDIDHVSIGYSFENPMENPDARLEWLTFPSDTDAGYEGLYLCSGLKKLETEGPLSRCDLQGLSLESLTARFSTLEDAARAVEDPSLIRQLTCVSQLENLEGLDLFPNLEELSVNARKLSDVDEIVALGSLKSLTIVNGDGLSDFSVFAAMEQLEELSIESENLKSLDFLKRMPRLKGFGLAGGNLLDLNGIEVLENLEKLSVTDCDELKNMDAIESLTGLQELTLEKPYDCQEPYLEGFTQLQRLTLQSFRSCEFLPGMTGLEELVLHGCDLPSNLDLSGLARLKKLTCTTTSRDRSLAFVGKITALEEVNLSGMVTYDDISGIFALPGLKELKLSGIECEIAFDKVAENTSLESLEMAGVKLYENVKVSGGGGIVYVDWDDVFLADHLDFFQRFPNLRKLDIADNEIKDISFMETLVKLEEIDLSDNYVTDIHALAALPSLRLVNCKGNPISNLRVLEDAQVHIISQ